MAIADSPSCRLLAMELREWRERRGKTGDQVALTLRVSPSLISRLEKAHRPPSEDQLRLLLNMYRVPEEDRPRLSRLRIDAARERLAGPLLDQEIVTALSCWAPDAVPVPLRTELYARAIIAAVRQVRRPTPSEIKRDARAGAAWQARLRGETEADEPAPEPLTLDCVMDEALLRRRRGATSAMEGQFRLLAALADLPGADLRVLPFDVDAPALGPFTLYSYGNDDLTDVVLLEGPAGVTRISDERTVTDYRYAYAELLNAAADKDTSAAMIKQAADTWA